MEQIFINLTSLFYPYGVLVRKKHMFGVDLVCWLNYNAANAREHIIVQRLNDADALDLVGHQNKQKTPN